jgi:hypothetical protein
VLAAACGTEPLQTLRDGRSSAAEPVPIPVADCQRDALSSTTVALFSFEQLADGTIADARGEHIGRAVGAALELVPGPGQCGSSVQFAADNSDTYIVVPDSPAWDVSEGALDFWIRPQTCLATWELGDGVIGRDAGWLERAGQMRILIKGECSLEVRFQQSASEQCVLTSPSHLPVGEWSHVGINFGGGSADLHVNGAAKRCEGNWSLAGNDNRWVFGGNPEWSSENGGEPVQFKARHLALDEVRLSNQRRDFWY